MNASLLSYGTTNLLAELLPLDEQLNGVTIDNHLLKVAERSEAELEPEQVSFIEAWAGLPIRWTPRGAHLLLQTRTKVLNGDLDDLPLQTPQWLALNAAPGSRPNYSIDHRTSNVYDNQHIPEN